MKAMMRLLLSFVLFASSLQAALGAIPAFSARENTFFVTAEKYLFFLNHVAASDPHHLYDEKMGAATGSCGLIERSGTPGAYHYEVTSEEKTTPLLWLSQGDAMRYFNWLQNIASSSSNNFSGVQEDVLTEHGAYDLPGDQLESTRDDGICLRFVENSVATSPSIDPLLQSNELAAHLTAEDYRMQSSLLQKENLSWDGLKIFTSSLIILGTLFCEGQFSLEQARREAAPDIRAHHEPELCYSNEAVAASLEESDPLTRFQREQERLRKVHFEEPWIDEALQQELNFKDATDRTFWGHLRAAGSQSVQGIGHLVSAGIYMLSPVLDNGRRIAAGGIIGYGVGAGLELGAAATHLIHGNFLEMMDAGTFGAYTGIVAFGGRDLYTTWQNRRTYVEVFSERRDEMARHFAAASLAWSNAWNLTAIKQEAAEKRRAFYEEKLSFYESELNKDHSFSPGQSQVLLEAQAHRILAAIDAQEKENTFNDWITMGEKFYGPEVMEYLLPKEKRSAETWNHFHEEKDPLLAQLRCAYISVARQWQKDSTNPNKIIKRKINILSELSPFQRLEFLRNYTEDLTLYASRELAKLTEENASHRQKVMEASCSLIGHIALLGGSVAAMSACGFLTGYFIGHEFPITFLSNNLYQPLAAANSAGIVYSAYVTFVSSAGQNIIRTNARATAAAFSDLNKILKRPEEQKLAQEKVDRATAVWQEAERKFQEIKSSEPPDPSSPVAKKSLRTSTMPGQYKPLPAQNLNEAGQLEETK